jgi:hypothetical protein
MTRTGASPGAPGQPLGQDRRSGGHQIRQAEHLLDEIALQDVLGTGREIGREDVVVRVVEDRALAEDVRLCLEKPNQSPYGEVRRRHDRMLRLSPVPPRLCGLERSETADNAGVPGSIVPSQDQHI